MYCFLAGIEIIFIIVTGDMFWICDENSEICDNIKVYKLLSSAYKEIRYSLFFELLASKEIVDVQEAGRRYSQDNWLKWTKKKMFHIPAKTFSPCFYLYLPYVTEQNKVLSLFISDRFHMRQSLFPMEVIFHSTAYRLCQQPLKTINRHMKTSKFPQI